MVMVQNLKTMKDISSSLEELATSPEECEKIVAWLAPELGYNNVTVVVEKKKEEEKDAKKQVKTQVKKNETNGSNAMSKALSAPRHDNRKKRRASFYGRWSRYQQAL